MKKKHLAILSSPVIKAIIAGRKSVEIRFSQKKIAPFGMVSVGDVVYMKPPGEDIVGQFEVRQVISFEGLDQNDRDLIRREYKSGIWLGDEKSSEEFFTKHNNAVFATVIKIGTVEQFIASPVRIQKRDLRGWLVIDS